jgi:hypothetical protein
VWRARLGLQDSYYLSVPLVAGNNLIDMFPDSEEGENASRNIVGNHGGTPIMMMHWSLREGVSVFHVSPHQNVSRLISSSNGVLDRKCLRQLSNDTPLRYRTWGWRRIGGNARRTIVKSDLCANSGVECLYFKPTANFLGIGASNVSPDRTYAPSCQFFSTTDQFTALPKGESLRVFEPKVSAQLCHGVEPLESHFIQLALHGGNLFFGRGSLFERCGGKIAGGFSSVLLNARHCKISTTP